MFQKRTTKELIYVAFAGFIGENLFSAVREISRNFYYFDKWQHF